MGEMSIVSLLRNAEHMRIGMTQDSKPYRAGGRLRGWRWTLSGLLVAVLGTTPVVFAQTVVETLEPVAGNQQAKTGTSSVAEDAQGDATQPEAAEPVLAQATSSEKPTATTDLTELNRAIFFFVDGQYQKVIDSLSAIEQHQIAGGEKPDVAVLYYLGLAYMELGFAADDATAKGEFFALARDYLDQVYIDPQIRRAELALTLSAAQTAAAPDVQGPQRQQAIDAYRAAFATIDEYIKGDGASDPYGHFFHGVAAWRISFYELAARSRAAKAFANTARTSLEVASSLADTKITDPADRDRFRLNVAYYEALLETSERSYAEARQLLTSIAEDATASEVLKGQARQLIAAVDEQAAKPAVTKSSTIILNQEGPIGPLAIRGDLDFTGGWDKNVILLGRYATPPTRIPDDEDYFAGVLASLDISRTFNQENDNLPWGESLTVGVFGETRHRWQPSIREYDENEYSGSFYFTWEPIRDLFFGMEYRFAEIQLGHKPFISSNRVVPAIWKDWRDDADEVRARTQLYYIYDYRGYTDKISDVRLDRDGHYNTIVIAQSFNLWKATELWPEYYAELPADDAELINADQRWLTVTADYVYENYATIGTEFDVFSHGLGVGVDVPLPYRLTLGLGTRFSWDNYTAQSIFDPQGEGRYDFRHTYELELKYQIVERGEVPDFPSLAVGARGFMMIELNDSNITDRYGGQTYTYDRGIYGVGLQVSF